VSEQRLVVGVDGGAAALHAVRWAAHECTSRDVALVLLHALGHGAGVEPVDADQVFVNAETQARAAVAGLEVRRRLERGTPAEALVAASATAQLVVLGRNGAGDVARSMLGTVGHRVATHAHCPVVVVPPDAAPGWTHGPVVVGLVPGRTGRAALRFALTYAARHDRPVVGVWAGERAGGGLLPSSIEAVLDEWPQVEFSLSRVEADPVTALDVSGADAGLLVLGCHHSDEPWSARPGAVPSALASRCAVPIALVGAVDEDT
jgi:nucleotide-binding universal stress UspA family protein